MRVAYFERETRELVSLNYADPLASPLAALDPAALGYVGYFAELIDEWAQDNDAKEPLFRLGSAVLDALADGVPSEPLARYFEYWLLRLQGVYPSIAAMRGMRPARSAAVVPRWIVTGCAWCAGPARTRRPPCCRPPRSRSCSARRGCRRRPLRTWRWTPGATRELERAAPAADGEHLEREPRSARVLREMGA